MHGLVHEDYWRLYLLTSFHTRTCLGDAIFFLGRLDHDQSCFIVTFFGPKLFEQWNSYEFIFTCLFCAACVSYCIMMYHAFFAQLQHRCWLANIVRCSLASLDGIGQQQAMLRIGKSFKTCFRHRDKPTFVQFDSNIIVAHALVREDFTYSHHLTSCHVSTCLGDANCFRHIGSIAAFFIAYSFFKHIRAQCECVIKMRHAHLPFYFVGCLSFASKGKVWEHRSRKLWVIRSDPC